MSDLAGRLGALSDSQRALLQLRLEAKRVHPEPIALIGMACRLPGADDYEAFWRLLEDGADAVTEVPATRWSADAFYDPDLAAPGKMNTRWGGFLRDVDGFDADFFAISPREAAQMDPQHRLLLEVAWEALEDAGQAPARLAGSPTAVYVGIFMDDFRRIQLADPRALGSYSGTGSTFCIAANRISYQLDLHGPSMAIDTACSSSLVTIHLACQSLASGESTLALAGGVNVLLLPEPTMELTKAGLMSPTGRCRAFSAQADGYVRGEGAGMVVLKPLSSALRDGDPIHAVIRGSAVNQDGRTNGLTSPNRFSQEAVLREACRRAGVEPQAVDYLEAHGTGTALGDAIECRALGAVFGPARPADRPLRVGSVKTNIGHLETAAGVMSVIKVALALERRRIPPSLHCEEPSPEIPFAELGLEVQTRSGSWPRRGAGPALAGVSSFGFGGTNAHLVLEEPPGAASSLAPPAPPGTTDAAPLAPAGDRAPQPAPAERPRHLLALSAVSEAALADLASRYARHLTADSGAALADVCFSANTGRSGFEFRLAAVAEDRASLAASLAHLDGPEPPAPLRGRRRQPPRVGFLFTGQGAQYAGMAGRLFASQPAFRQALLACEEALAPELATPLTALLFESADAKERLDDTAGAQPALFAVEYALAVLWQSWGVVPEALLGHSIGEYAAACVAGILSLADAARLVARRGRLMGELPHDGIMATVFAPEAAVAAEIATAAAGELAIAAINAPASTVVAGRRQAVEALRQRFAERGTRVELLRVSHAFHSPLMEPVLDRLEAEAARCRFASARLPLVSNVTGDVFPGGGMDAGYVRRHARRPVRFMDGVATLRRLGCDTFVEIGPGSTLLSLVSRIAGDEHGLCLLPSVREGRDDWETILDSVATLFVRGAEIDWHGFDSGYARRRLRLPTYPFQHDHRRNLSRSNAEPGTPAGDPLLGRRVESPLLSGVLYESTLDADGEAELAEHRIAGDVVVPGARYLAMVLAAAQAPGGGGNVDLLDVRFTRALVLPGGARRNLQLALLSGEFKLWSRGTPPEEGEEWVLHASGGLAAADRLPGSPDAPADLAVIRGRCRETIDGVSFYQDLGERRLDLGPRFRRVQQVFRGAGEALGELLPDEPGSGSSAPLSTALLDAAFQVLAATLPSGGEGVTYLPTGIERLRVLDRSAIPRWCHARLRAAEPGAACLTGDLRLVNAQGATVGEVSGLEVRRVEGPLAAARGGLGELVFRIDWERRPPRGAPPAPTPAEGGTWLLLVGAAGEGAEVARRLEARGASCREVVVAAPPAGAAEGISYLDPGDPEPFVRALRQSRAGPGPAFRGAIHLVGLSPAVTFPADDPDQDLLVAERNLCGSVLGLVQALSTLPLDGWRGLWLVTRGAQAAGASWEPGAARFAPVQAPLWGLGTAIGYEHPELRCRMLDLDPAGGDDAARLVAEVAAADREDRVAWRGEERFTARLAAAGPLPAGRPVRDDGTYLVSGGLGALGLEVARGLAARGARHLVLAGRRPPQGEAAEAIAELRRRGTVVEVAAGDVSRREEVAALLASIAAALPPLCGVFHAAGVLDEGLLQQQSWSRFARVLAPKVLGAWNLHLLTRALPLDLFVLFSSVVPYFPFAGLGTYAAANSFLDGLAHSRRAAGLPALSIGWGPWSRLGMAARKEEASAARRREEGIGLIAPEDGIELLNRLSGVDLPQVLAISVDWPTMAVGPGRDRPVLEREIARRRLVVRAAPPPPGAAPRGDLAAMYATVAVESRGDLVTGYLGQQLRDILKLASAKDLDPERPFAAYGLDSLMAMTLRDRIKAATGRELPASALFDHPTLENLSRYVHTLLAGGSAEPLAGGSAGAA